MNHFGNVERDTADMKLLYLPPTAKKTMAIIQQFTLQFFFPKFFLIEENTSTVLEWFKLLMITKGSAYFSFATAWGHFLQHIEYLIYMYL